MKKITFKEYKEAVLQHYEVVKSEDVSGILMQPSPAQMRNFCSMVYDKGVSKSEEELLRVFFEVRPDENLKRAIDNFAIEKFKPIISFLKREKETENITRVELCALLVDFNPRPYASYLKRGEVLKVDNRSLDADLKSNDEKALRFETTSNLENRNGLLKKWFLLLIVVIGIITVGFLSKDYFVKQKECMQWQGDHYEVVHCDVQEIGGLASIEPVRKEVLKLKQIAVCDTTTFFREGKAVIWYCKVGASPEFFNTHGIHPETGKALRPVTKYIIKKYVLHQN